MNKVGRAAGMNGRSCGQEKARIPGPAGLSSFENRKASFKDKNNLESFYDVVSIKSLKDKPVHVS